MRATISTSGLSIDRDSAGGVFTSVCQYNSSTTQVTFGRMTVKEAEEFAQCFIDYINFMRKQEAVKS